MKKTILSLSMAGVLMLGVGGFAFADDTNTEVQNPSQDIERPGQGLGDEDGDGICDLTGNEVRGCQGQGRNGQGRVDENGDGICDLTGQELGARRGQGKRNCQNN